MTILLIMLVAVASVVLWPLWMRLGKKVIGRRVYFWLAPFMTYSQNQALFRSIWYFVFGILASAVLWSVLPATAILYVKAQSAFNAVWGVSQAVMEGILLLVANSSVIVTLSSLVFPAVLPRAIRRSDFAGSWLEMYMKVESLKSVLAFVLLPVFVEELFFRALLTPAFFDSFVALEWYKRIVASVTFSTALFVTQQVISLKNRIQLLAVGVGASCIGFINATAYLLGASFYSLLVAHYGFVIFIMFLAARGEAQDNSISFRYR